jgi:hypothetical protein
MAQGQSAPKQFCTMILCIAATRATGLIAKWRGAKLTAWWGLTRGVGPETRRFPNGPGKTGIFSWQATC